MPSVFGVNRLGLDAESVNEVQVTREGTTVFAHLRRDADEVVVYGQPADVVAVLMLAAGRILEQTEEVAP